MNADRIKTLLRSGKTTWAGVLALGAVWLHALSLLLDGDATTAPAWETLIPLTIAAIGLVAARDGDKTSEEVGARR